MAPASARSRSTTDQVELIVALGSVAVVLLIGLGVFVVVRRGLRPIEAMARQADRITGGDLTDRVATHNPRTEVGRLGAALNGMLTRIDASQQQMRRFFGDASHELRTPLASLRANAQLYQQGAVQDPDEVDEVMDRIVLETRRMGRLVDDMLRLARLGQHPGQSREPVDVTAVVTGCAERARVADPARTWQVRVAKGLTVTGDQELLRRAVDNLVTNVHVHTAAGTVGAVTASASDDNGDQPSRSMTMAPAFRRITCRTSLSASTAPERDRAAPAQASGWPSQPRSPPRTAAPCRPRRQNRTACGSR